MDRGAWRATRTELRVHSRTGQCPKADKWSSSLYDPKLRMDPILGNISSSMSSEVP